MCKSGRPADAEAVVVGVMRSEAVVSERRACGLVKVHRATCRYRRRRIENPHLRERLRELAATRRRFGYRRAKDPAAEARASQ